MDPATMMAIMSMLKGDSQLSGIAPTPNLGGGKPLGLLGEGDPFAALARPVAKDPIADITSPPASSQAQPNVETPATTPDYSMGMEPDKEKAVQKPGPFGKFFANLDQGLQSPSQVLGLGLLNQIDPRLPLGGLLAMGLLNKQR